MKVSLDKNTPILSNPYRVLGIYTNASIREIKSAAAKLSKFAVVGKKSEGVLDLNNLLTEVDRSKDSIQRASNDLAISRDRVVNSLFWFMKETEKDERAITCIKEGDFSTAIDVLKKDVSCSQLVNVAVIFLLHRKYEAALYVYTKLLVTSKYRMQLIAYSSDNSRLFSEQELYEAFYKKLNSLFPFVAWIVHFSTTSIYPDLNSYSLNRVDVKDYIGNSKLFNHLKPSLLKETRNLFDKLLDEASKTEDMGMVENLHVIRKLNKEGFLYFRELKLLLGDDNMEFVRYCDKYANQSLNNCISYYEKDSSNPRRAENVYNITHRVYKWVAKGAKTKERCKKNFEIIKEQYDKIAPQIVENQAIIIYGKIKKFNSGGRESLYSDLQVCISELSKIKALLKNMNSANGFYLHISSDVVNATMDVIVNEVNEKQDKYNNARTGFAAKELSEYYLAIQWAMKIMDLIEHIEKNVECGKRYISNRNTLVTLQYQVNIQKNIKGQTQYTYEYIERTANPNNATESRGDKKVYIVAIILCVFLYGLLFFFISVR